jgi:hypothetical protein
MNIDEMKAEAKRLLATTKYDSTYWSAKRQELLHNIINDDITKFLSWNVMTETMYVVNSPYAFYEHSFLAMSRYKTCLVASPVGGPSASACHPQSCDNHIHTAYHLLKFESLARMPIEANKSVIEFGGGYGCMANIVKHVSPGTKYYIYDFPEFSLIQKYYLEQNGIHDVVFVNDIEKIDKNDFDLLIATWSLSESPAEVREKFMRYVTPRNFLIAFQQKFEKVDNEVFFSDMVKLFPNVNWMSERASHLPQVQLYLIGAHR